MTEKAVAYLAAGVARVWVVDVRSRTVTVFRVGAVPMTVRGDRALDDEFLPGLGLTPNQIFDRAGL
jgi:Uma2 family endonuclease